MPSLRCWNSFLALLLLVCPLVMAAVDERKVPGANTPSIGSSSNSHLLRGGRDRNLQECGLDTASNITKRQSILFVDVAGRPGDFSKVEKSELISKLQPTCNSTIDSSYYTWSDTALKKLVGSQLDMSPSELFASTTRNFTLKLKIKMETNLPKTVAPIEDDPFSLFAAQDRDDNSLMSTFSSDCECALPTKDVMLARLQALVEEGNVLPSIDAVYDVRTALQVQCPAPPAANETAANSPTTPPTDPSLLTTLAVDIETYEDDNITFGLLGQYMLYSYNALSEERCDGLFRNVHTARMLTFNRTNTTTETSSQGTRWLQAAGSDSLAPSPAPTIRGADLFTMVWELEGSCENCAADQQLFDQAMQQSAGRIRVLKQERRSAASASRPSQEVLFETKLSGPPAATSHLSSHRDLGVTTNNKRLRCFCPMPLVEEPLSVEDFSERLQSEVSTDSRLNFTVVDVEDLGVSSAPSRPPTESPTKSPSARPSASPTASPTCPNPPALGSMPDNGEGFTDKYYTGLIDLGLTSCSSGGITQDCPDVDGYDVFRHDQQRSAGSQCLRIQLQCCRSGTIVVKKGCSQQCVGSSVQATDQRVCYSCPATQAGATPNCDALVTDGKFTVSIDFVAEAGETYYIYIPPETETSTTTDTTCFIP